MAAASFRTLVNEILSRIYPDWCKTSTVKDMNGMSILGDSIFNKLKQNMSGDIERNPSFIEEGRLYLGLTLGMSKHLIVKYWD